MNAHCNRRGKNEGRLGWLSLLYCKYSVHIIGMSRVLKLIETVNNESNGNDLREVEFCSKIDRL